MHMFKPLKVAVIGAGNRARTYLSCLPDWVKVGYIVEPEPLRLAAAARLCSVPEDYCFRSSDEFFASNPSIDAAIIATPDRTHVPFSLEAVSRGWHVLLEKPVALTESGYRELEEATERMGVNITPCLEMRYHRYFSRIRELARSGIIGSIRHIDHTEHIGPDRMAHSFVRGLWSRHSDAGPIFLSKCCHDADFLIWVTGERVLTVSSSGSIAKFKFNPDTPDRCSDCSISDCPYSAVKLYKERGEWIDGFDVPPGDTFSNVIDEELRRGRWGRCVYHCDNDVYDTQDVHVQLTGGILLDMHLEGTSMLEGRSTLIEGTCGTITAENWIIRVLKDGETVLEEDYASWEELGLHGGADKEMLEDFFEAVANGGKPALTLQSAFEGHRLCYLAG